MKQGDEQYGMETTAAEASLGEFRAEMAVLYTPRFVIQAHLHPAGDMRVSNLFNVMSGMVFPTSRAQLHPIVPTCKLPCANQ